MEDLDALYKKLMLPKFASKLLVAKPQDCTLLDAAGFDTVPQTKVYDLVFQFVFSLDAMEQAIRETAARGLIPQGGYLYLAYPKKHNKRYKDVIDRDDIIERFDLAEGNGFIGDTPMKFNKMVSLDDTFTVIGLKRDDQRVTKTPTVSACVADYIERIPDLRDALAHRPEILALYDGLPYGYQKDWARYVYSSRTDATREKRLLEMADILLAGYKTKALYRQGKM